MHITFCGAAGMVTGSCYLVTTGKSTFLVDCGMFQESKQVTKLNFEPFPFDPKKLDAVFITHAHLDHTGRLPLLIKQGFDGPIYCTEATKHLTELILQDAAHIQQMDTIDENHRRAHQGLAPRKPLFTTHDVHDTMALIKTVHFHETHNLLPDIKATWYGSGHILGAASIRLQTPITSAIFSGDIGQYDNNLLNDPEHIPYADTIVIESTYGNRLHPHQSKKEQFDDIMAYALKHKGMVLIPSFAVERTQEVLFDLFTHDYGIPIYLDSPMASHTTTVYEQYPELYNEHAQQVFFKKKNPFHFPQLHLVKTTQQSEHVCNIPGPAIVIAGSGMCNAGRIKQHIKYRIEQTSTQMVFVGYQAPGTLGNVIMQKEPIIRLLGCQRHVKAKIHSLDSYSGHADYAQLLQWVTPLLPKAKRVFITHGQPEAAQSLQEKMKTLKTHTTFIIPQLYETHHA
ncbi:MAG: MBL fold metallo-hydrolase [Candidatus Woesearchaeota archaeon]